MIDPVSLVVLLIGTGVLLYAASRTRWDHISVSALWGAFRMTAVDRSDDSEAK